MGIRTDLRVIKTKKKLQESLLNSLKTKKLDDITISEICDEASINRNTFYSHYRDIKSLCDELKADYLGQFLSEVEKMKLNGDTAQKIITYFLQTISVNKDFFLLLFSDSSGIVFLSTIVKMCLKGSSYSAGISSPVITEEDFFTFIVGGATNMIYEWINTKENIDSKEMGAKISFFIYNIKNTYY